MYIKINEHFSNIIKFKTIPFYMFNKIKNFVTLL